MQWSGVGAGNPGTNPKLTVELPAGVSYRAGSISDVVAHPGGAATAAVVGGTLEIYLPNLDGSESGEVAFELVYTCDADFSNPLLLNIAAVSDEATFPDVTTPINNTYAAPQLVLNGSTNSTITDVEVGDNFTRTTSIQQTGQFANLYAFDLTFAYGADLSVGSQTISDGVSTVSLTGLTSTGGTITLSSTDPAFSGLAWPFYQGDVWTISEDVTVDACTDILHSASANYQCGTNPCQTPAQITHSTQLENNAPVITEISSTRAFTADACITDPVTSEYTWEVTGKAYNTNFQIRARDTRSYIDPSSIEIDYGTGTYVAYSGGFNNVTNQSPCGSPEIRYATLDPYAPLIDGSVAAQTIRIRYNLLTCCPSGGCSENTGSIFGSYSYLYAEDQCGVQIEDRADVYSLNTDVSAADQIPAFMTDGTPENFQYDLNYMGVHGLLLDRGTVCMEFTIPVELNVLGGHTTTAPNGDVLSAGTAYWYDVSLNTGNRREATITSLGGGDYEACFPAGDYHGTASKIFIPVEYICSPMNCGGSATTSMVMGLRLGTQPACGPASECLITMMCEEATVSLDNTCCGVSCDGMTHMGFDVVRDCYGEPDNDNDGCADASGSLDMNLVATKRALKGDEMTFEALARVNLQNPLDSFNYVYFELAFPDPHGIGASTTITITDVSEGLTYTCSSVNVFPNGTDAYIYYLTTDLLRGCGDIPTDFKWEDNDLITLDGSYTVLATQDECGVEQVNIDAQFYASRSPLPPPGPDRLRCNTPVPSEYSRVGYTWELYEHRREEFGCAGGRYMFRVDFCIGGGPINVQPFPYEIRQFGQPKRMGMQVPTGLRFDSLELYHYRFSKRVGNNTYVYNEDVTAYALEADGEVWFDFDSWFDKDPAACEDDDRPNGGYRVYLDAFFEGTCNSEPSRPTTFFEAEMDFCSALAAQLCQPLL